MLDNSHRGTYNKPKITTPTTRTSILLDAANNNITNTGSIHSGASASSTGAGAIGNNGVGASFTPIPTAANNAEGASSRYAAQGSAMYIDQAGRAARERREARAIQAAQQEARVAGLEADAQQLATTATVADSYPYADNLNTTNTTYQHPTLNNPNPPNPNPQNPVNSNRGGSAVVDARTQDQKQGDFYKAAREAEDAAAAGDPSKLRNFDKFFSITRPENEYSQDFQQGKQKERFAASLSAAQTSAAAGDAGPLKNFDKFFNIQRDPSEYSKEFYETPLVIGKVVDTLPMPEVVDVANIEEPTPPQGARIEIDDSEATAEQRARRIAGSTTSDADKDVNKNSSVAPAAVRLEENTNKRQISPEAIAARKSAIESRLQKIAAQRQPYGGTAGATSVVKDSGAIVPPPIAGGGASQNGLPTLP